MFKRIYDWAEDQLEEAMYSDELTQTERFKKGFVSGFVEGTLDGALVLGLTVSVLCVVKTIKDCVKK